MGIVNYKITMPISSYIIIFLFNIHEVPKDAGKSGFITIQSEEHYFISRDKVKIYLYWPREQFNN